MEEQEYIIGMCGGQPIFGYPTDASEDTVSYSYNNIEDEPVLVPTQKLSKVLSTLHTLIAKLGKPFSGSYNDLTDKPTIPSTKADIGLGNVDNTADSVKSVNYANSAGSAPANGGRASTCGTSDNTNAFNYTGGFFDGCVSALQTSDSVWGQNNWGSYLCFAHGNPNNYYHQLIKFPFWGPPKYHRLEDGTDRGWFDFVTSENVGNFKCGSAGYADSAGRCTYATETTRVLNTADDVKIESISGAVNLYAANSRRLSVQADGNLVLYHNINNPVWSTGTSSLRFKKNVNDVTEERARKILDIRVRTFDYKENQVCATGLYDKVGVIAEEVSPIMRDVVIFDKVDDSGNVRKTEYNVDYQGFVPYLIKMVQMQQDEINDLKHRIDLLEKRN